MKVNTLGWGRGVEIFLYDIIVCMNQEQKLTQYILNKYSPRAILIHGSRANGYAREHSDWDFVILVDKDTEVLREIVDGANIEIRVMKLPFNSESIDKWLIFRGDNVKVVFDPDNLSPDIINRVTEYYKKPIPLRADDISAHNAWYRSHLDGMIDYKDEQEAFFRKLGELYTRSIMYWFEYLHNTYMPQVYLSLPRIKEEDPEYYKLLQILAGNHTNEEKIEAGEKIHKRIWG